MGKKQPKQNLQKQIEFVIETLKAYKPEKVILFGSAASGEIKEGSDIDLLAIKKTQKRGVERILEANRYLKDIKLPIDLVVYTPEEFVQAQRDNLMFIEEVLARGRIVYEKS